MHAVDLIVKKRNGLALTREEISFFISGVTGQTWPDYQISALLMAIVLQGMTLAETVNLTLAMAHSGHLVDLSALHGLKVDKHSTGGVADTTTLILAPLVAACGLPLVKMSGRGLGFTGGTIDKLESIPGFRVNLSQKEALEIVRQNNMVIMAQTEQLAPADKRLYALRDVTGTVDSIPLIASSIMSKKIASGADVIVLDVKCGDGAFMHDLEQARLLSRQMVAIGNEVGRKVTAVISSMDQPLGSKIGNTLEVEEAIEQLKADDKSDLLELTYDLAAQLLISAGKAPCRDTARALLVEALTSKRALDHFGRFLELQGADKAVIDDPGLLPQPRFTKTYTARQSGYLAGIKTAMLGRLVVQLGGGRWAKDDPLDYTAGITLSVRLGQRVEKGQPVARLQANDQAKLLAVEPQLSDIFTWQEKPVDVPPVVLDIIE